jgi:hypothetical protein
MNRRAVVLATGRWAPALSALADGPAGTHGQDDT